MDEIRSGYERYAPLFGREVEVTVNRPLGSRICLKKDASRSIRCPLNSGYLTRSITPDGGETVEIFRMLGLKDTTIPQYEFGPKSIHRNTIKGKLAYAVQQLQLTFHTRRRALSKRIKQTPFEQQYTTHIDDETYSFIVAHADRDAFLRSQNMLNWIINYPFVRVTADAKTAPKRTEFNDVATEYTISCVRVLVDSKLVGVYVLRVNATQMAVKYLYYDTQYQNAVFAAIASTILEYNKPAFETREKDLANFLEPYYLFPKLEQKPISFSYPENTKIDLSKRFQSESDNFV